jgi:hypothetical protein
MSENEVKATAEAAATNAETQKKVEVVAADSTAVTADQAAPAVSPEMAKVVFYF